MYDIYLQYGHNSPEYEDLIQQKAEANSELREEENGKDWIVIVVMLYRTEGGGGTGR